METILKKYKVEGETMMWGRSIAILHMIIMESLSDELPWKRRSIWKKAHDYLEDDSNLRELQVQRAWGRSKLKGVRSFKKGRVVEEQWARNRMAGNEARQVGRSTQNLANHSEDFRFCSRHP